MALARRCAETHVRRDRASQHLGMTIESTLAPGRATAHDDRNRHHDQRARHLPRRLRRAAGRLGVRVRLQHLQPGYCRAGLDVTFLRSARLGDILVATAVERARMGKSGIYDVTVARQPTADVRRSPSSVAGAG